MSMAAKRGRPKAAVPKDRTVTVRMSELEYKIVQLAAKEKGMKASTWIREAIERAYSAQAKKGARRG